MIWADGEGEGFMLIFSPLIWLVVVVVLLASAAVGALLLHRHRAKGTPESPTNDVRKS